MINIDDEWDSFLNNGDDNQLMDYSIIKKTDINLREVPEPTEIYISTKSKIAFLNKPIDLNLFWNIPIIPYYNPQQGIIKKQIKINCKSMDEVLDIENKIKDISLCDVQIINQIHNPTNRNKFKDIRKISIGLCKKDILSYRCKKKQAFYNCFVLILRLKVDSLFKEYHIKIFNTGKMEIPGVQNEIVFNKIIIYLKDLFQQYFKETISFSESCETVLINSNFNCGFYINRDSLFQILTQKYGLHAIYDPCSYPGVQCKFYYDYNSREQNGVYKNEMDDKKGISFMIFRTGSVLIVGKCEDSVLLEIYDFLKILLKNEFSEIYQNNGGEVNDEAKKITKPKNKKIRKKNIVLAN